MKLPTALRNAPRIDVEAFSVFTPSEALADIVIRRVLYRNRTIPTHGFVQLNGRRQWWCLRCMALDTSIYQSEPEPVGL